MFLSLSLSHVFIFYKHICSLSHVYVLQHVLAYNIEVRKETHTFIRAHQKWLTSDDHLYFKRPKEPALPRWNTHAVEMQDEVDQTSRDGNLVLKKARTSLNYNSLR